MYVGVVGWVFVVNYDDVVFGDVVGLYGGECGFFVFEYVGWIFEVCVGFVG